MPQTLDPASDILIKRLERHASAVLAPRVWRQRTPAAVGVWQPDGPATLVDAARAEYTPVSLGHEWGPKWSTAWFRIEAPVWSDQVDWWLRFSTDTEAVLYRADAFETAGYSAQRGFDVNHTSCELATFSLAPDEPYLYVEASCNHPWGVVAFDWDTPDTARRWASERPGRLDLAEFAKRDYDAWLLHTRFELLLGLLATLRGEDGPVSPRARQLEAGLVRAADFGRVGDFASEVALVDELLAVPAAGSTPVGIAVGHAHIDTAWLWTIEHTRKKIVRSWTNALDVLEFHREMTFIASQAQHYAWLAEDEPDVFEHLAVAVSDGAIEPTGAMWVEPDMHCLGAESFVRQVLHGCGYWREAFPSLPDQRVLFLPDTFGFGATIPTLMRHCGLDTFVTNKLHWNGANTFPHTDFVWRGLDGSEVAAHNTPSGDYNNANTAREQRKALRQHRTPRPDAEPAVFLHPFGYGDGGGGPTMEMAERVIASGDCDGLARLRFGTMADFAEALHARVGELPVVDDELYLELHRGTLTTQAWLKRANRRAEEALVRAEALLFAGPGAIEADKAERARALLDKAWKLVLLNQFHDTLPGSSIAGVYEDARVQYEEVATIVRSLLDKAARVWKPFFDASEDEEPVLVFNATGFEQSAVLTLAGGSGADRLLTTPGPGVVRRQTGEPEPVRKFVKAVPALGARVRDMVTSSECVPVTVEADGEDVVFDNGIIEAVIDRTGRITSLRRSGCSRQAACEHEPMGGLALYHDLPHMWDAWEIDPGYEQSERVLDDACETFEVVEAGPLRAAVVCERPIGMENEGERSTVRITLALEAGRPRVDITYEFDWREEHTLVRALFPTSVRSRTATFETQAGHIERPTHRSGPIEAARFEVPMQRWMDLSEPGLGVAVLNDCKFGGSAHDHTLGVSLLRSPTHPDPTADRGSHTCTLSVMVHEGDWRSAGVIAEAALLNQPLTAVAIEPGQAGEVDPDGEPMTAWAPIELVYPKEPDHAARLEVLALKPADDASGDLILRLAETHGGGGECAVCWGIDAPKVIETDGLERPLDTEQHIVDHDDNVTMLRIAPFEIVTLRALR